MLLEYPVPAEDAPRPATKQVLPGAKTPPVRKNSAAAKDQIAIGFVGAGNYASSMLLPHLAKLPAANLAHVATTKSLSAVNAQKKFGFTTASTDSESVFEDESLDAIFIVTRHATHAKLVCRALATGKAVFVEKPLALTREETDQIAEAVDETGNDRLMVGFNRRFAPLLIAMRKDFGAVAATASTRYLVNAGPLAKDSWYLNEEAEGSRFTGEGGHFIDTLAWWADSLVEEVYAVRGPEQGDVQATFRFANGASGTIAYLTGGNARFPKETMDVTGGGRSARLDNFKAAAVWTGRGKSITKARGGQDKGQRSEMAAFVEAVRTGAPMPISLDSLLATTRATIAVGESLLSGRPERGVSAGRDLEARAGTRGASAGCLPPRWPGGSGSRLCDGRGRAARYAPVTWIRCLRWPRRGRPVSVGSPPCFRPAPPRLVPDKAASALIADADRLLKGEWEMLGVLRTDMEHPDWFRDPVTGRRSAPEAYAFSLNQRDESAVGNIKQVWEVNRLQHLTLLAAAWYLTGVEAYASAGRGPAQVVVAGEPVYVRGELDERHRARRPADQPRLDQAAARRLAGRQLIFLSTTISPYGRSTGISSTLPRSRAVAPRRITT